MKRIKFIFLILSLFFCALLFLQFQWVHKDNRILAALNRFYSSVKITPLIRHALKNEHLINGLEFKDDFNQPILKPQWDIVSGKAFVERQKLVLLTNFNHKNTGVVLPDTTHWHNFELTFQIQWKQTEGIWVYLKRQDQSHYLRLGVSLKQLTLQEKTGDETTRVLKTIPYPAQDKANPSFRVIIRGAKIFVYKDDLSLWQEGVPFSPSLVMGDIGFYLWAESGDSQEIEIDNVSVRKLPVKIYTPSQNLFNNHHNLSFYPWKELEYMVWPTFIFGLKGIQDQASSYNYLLAASYFHGVPIISSLEGSAKTTTISSEEIIKNLEQWPYFKNVSGFNIALENEDPPWNQKNIGEISKIFEFLEKNNKIILLTIPASMKTNPALLKIIKGLNQKHRSLIVHTYPKQLSREQTMIIKGEILNVF